MLVWFEVSEKMKKEQNSKKIKKKKKRKEKNNDGERKRRGKERPERTVPTTTIFFALAPKIGVTVTFSNTEAGPFCFTRKADPNGHVSRSRDRPCFGS